MPTTTLEQRVNELTNIRVMEPIPMTTPKELKEKYPLTKESALTTVKTRRHIKNILNKKDSRFIIITGPCSIHNPEEALEYARNLKKLSDKVSDKILIIMRAYLEKPRTGYDWEGLISDPDMNGTYDINKGYEIARKLLLEINELGVPVATEIVDERYTPQYIDDLISWAAIGARTVESQDHRKAVSGYSMPVGFKNNTAGDIKTAVDAVKKSRYPYKFPGIDLDLKAAIYPTKGNPYTHIVLRGGKQPNYDGESVRKASELLKQAGLPLNIIIDCSHGNSGKDYKKQPDVFRNIIQQRLTNPNIIGAMLESHHKEGKQPFIYLKDNPKNLDPNQSMTDGCIGWEITEELVEEAYKILT